MTARQEELLGKYLAEVVDRWLDDQMPEDVFPEDVLEDWANEHGFVKAGTEPETT